MAKNLHADMVHICNALRLTCSIDNLAYTEITQITYEEFFPRYKIKVAFCNGVKVSIVYNANTAKLVQVLFLS